MNLNETEWYCPSVDVCAWCGDCECDGIACIAGLDPDDLDDHEAIERLHAWLRRGQLAEQAERYLAYAENRGHLLPTPSQPRDNERQP